MRICSRVCHGRYLLLENVPDNINQQCVLYTTAFFLHFFFDPSMDFTLPFIN